MNCLELNSSFASCLGRESNPHGRFGPRDFRTTMAFATISVCGLDYLCTFLLSEAWLKIAIGFTRYGFLEFTTFYISLFRECTQIMSKSLVSTISPPRPMGDCGYKDNEFFLNRKPRPAPSRQGHLYGCRPRWPERRSRRRARFRRGTCAAWRRWPGRRWSPG